MSLDIQGLLRRPSGFKLELDQSLPDQGVTAIIGASGCGKSSLLRIVAGLEPAAGMTVRWRGTEWSNPTHHLPPYRRPVTLAMQDAALFPHLNVAANLALPRRLLPAPPDALRYETLIDQLALGDLLNRRVHTLSGGQRQRVAIARALLRPAQLWLFDEPMSALDSSARDELAPMLRTLCRAAGTPVLYVTHNLNEVLQIADHLLVMEAGRVLAAGSPAAISAQLDHPQSRQLDIGGILEASVLRYDERHGLTELRLEATPLWVQGDLRGASGTVRILVPAREVTVAITAPTDSSILNRLPARIDAVEPQTDGSVRIRLDCHGQTLYARLTSLSQERLALAPGQSVFALIKSVALNADVH